MTQPRARRERRPQPRLPAREHLTSSPCLRLLFAIVFMLIAYPAAAKWQTAIGFLLAAQAVMLLAAIHALGHSSARLWFGGALAAGVWLTGLARVVAPPDAAVGLVFVSLVLAGAFYLLVLLAFLAYVLGSGPVTVDKLYGATCVYLLMALFWAVLFDLIQVADASAFTIPKEIPSPLRHADLVYFSLETLTTLGYGDIKPIALEARYLAVIEATTGVLYTTILVARLIGLYRGPDADVET